MEKVRVREGTWGLADTYQTKPRRAPLYNYGYRNAGEKKKNPKHYIA